MIKLIEKPYGNEIKIDGTYKEILKDLETISRALIYNGFGKNDVIEAVVDGFFEDSKQTAIDGNLVSDGEIDSVIKQSLNKPIKESIKRIKEIEKSIE